MISSEDITTRKEVKRANLEENQEKPESKLPKRYFLYHVKHKIELTQKALKRQIVRRFHAREWSFSKENQDSLKKLTRALKTTTSIQAAHVDFFEDSDLLEPSEFTKIYEALKVQCSLKSIDFSLARYEDGNQAFHKICQLTKRLPFLQKIHVRVPDNKAREEITDKGLRFLAHGFRRTLNLQEVQLYLQDCSEITDEGIKAISKALEKLKLFCFKLDLNSGEKIKDDAVKAVSRMLEEQMKLKTLSLGFSGYEEISDKGLEILAQVLERPSLSSLQKIRLEFKSKPSITDFGVQKISQSLGSLVSLQKLHLGLESNKITDTGILQLSEALKSLTALQKLNLDVESNKITDAGILQLSEALKSLTALQKLTFDLKSNITDSGLSSLSESLQELSLLKQLKMCFPRWQITNEGVQALGESLEQLASLNDIALDFSSPFDILPQDFNYLVQALSQLSLLEKLYLNFSGCGMTDQELQNLGEMLKNHSLKELHLYFSDCTEITDEGVRYISESFKGSKQLTDVTLSFNGCEKLEEAGDAITESLETLPRVETIELDFEYCKMFLFNDGHEGTLKSLPTIKSLKVSAYY